MCMHKTFNQQNRFPGARQPLPAAAEAITHYHKCKYEHKHSRPTLLPGPSVLLKGMETCFVKASGCVLQVETLSLPRHAMTYGIGFRFAADVSNPPASETQNWSLAIILLRL